MDDPIPVFILSLNRPIYLWASLDSLYKYTRFPSRFILGDNGSDDPLVPGVIEGFQRRGMFHRVFMRPVNDNYLVEFLFRENLDLLTGKYVAYIESDVMVFQQTPCWLTRFVDHMERDEKLAMLGSLVDTSDFVDYDQGQKVAPGNSEEQVRFLVKAESPERDLAALRDDARELLYIPADFPHNPPGRLLIFRVDALRFLSSLNLRPLTDKIASDALLRAGYKTAIATTVMHRHLSLANLFDYPDYDRKLRDQFFYNRNRERSTSA